MINIALPRWANWIGVLRAPDGAPLRHVVIYGGRGSAKSWTAARVAIQRARCGPVRILCVREFQNSLGDSVKQLLEDTIRELKLGPDGEKFFRITATEITGSNGSKISFVGLHSNEASIKSFEGYDIVWIEEAQSLSKAAIEVLIPTIRRPGSQLWWTFNPRDPSDPVDQLFRGANGPPPGTVLIPVSWRNNPWFPEELKRELEFDRARDPDKYNHIWEGDYLRHSDAEVFKEWSVENFEMPANAQALFGADFGFNDPTTLVRCFLGRWAGRIGAREAIADASGDCLFIDHEAYQVLCQLDDTAALFAGSDDRSPPRWPNRFVRPGVPGAARGLIRADSSRLDVIGYLAARGLQIVPAAKGPGSVKAGIALLGKYNIVVHPRCRKTIEEFTHYRWKLDRHTGDMIDELPDTKNHTIDALRYAVEGVQHPIDTRHASAGPRIMATSGYGVGRGFSPEIEEKIRQSTSRHSVPGALHEIEGFLL